MPRTRSLAWAELKIGLLTIAAISIAALLIFSLTGSRGFFWQRYYLKARLPNAAGLVPGSPVRVAGVQVGSVRGYEFAGDRIDVTFQVNKTYRDKITTGSTAFLGSVSLLGEGAVDITPSTVGTPIPEWGHVPLGRAKGQIADVAEQALTGIEEITKIVRDVGSGKGTVGKLMTDDRVYVELQQLAETAGQMTRELQQGRGTLGKLLTDPKSANALEASLKNIEDMTRRLNAGEGSLGKLLKDEAFSQSLTGATSNLKELTERLRERLVLQQLPQAALPRIEPAGHVLDVLERRLERIGRLGVLQQLAERAAALLEFARHLPGRLGQLLQLNVDAIVGHELTDRALPGTDVAHYLRDLLDSGQRLLRHVRDLSLGAPQWHVAPFRNRCPHSGWRDVDGAFAQQRHRAKEGRGPGRDLVAIRPVHLQRHVDPVACELVAPDAADLHARDPNRRAGDEAGGVRETRLQVVALPEEPAASGQAENQQRCDDDRRDRQQPDLEFRPRQRSCSRHTVTLSLKTSADTDRSTGAARRRRPRSRSRRRGA